MTRTITWISFLVIMLSCGSREKEPAGILKPAQMQAVLWDFIRADAFTTEFIARDSAKNAVEENLKLQQEIFSIHHISKEDFYRSYDYYKKNSRQMKTIMDSMISQAERDRSLKISPLKEQ